MKMVCTLLMIILLISISMKMGKTNHSFRKNRVPLPTLFLLLGWLICMSLVVVAQDKRANSLVLYEQGEAAHNAGNYKLALEYLNNCLKESPGFVEAYFTRGATKEQLQDL